MKTNESKSYKRLLANLKKLEKTFFKSFDHQSLIIIDKGFDVLCCGDTGT